jgi:pimeloyl-ACP methyl ester carboxylesterase
MFYKRDDANLFVSDFGSGPKTIMAHGGWVGSGELWHSPFEILSRKWRTVTYDHRGTGATTHTPPRITFEHLVDDLFWLLDALEIDRCVLAAESAGSMVALEAVLRAPERFEGLCLVGGRWETSPPGSLDDRIAACRKNYKPFIDQFVDACVPEEDGADWRRWGKKIVYRADPEHAAQLMELLYGVSVEERVASIRIPTLLIHGEKDVINPLSSARKLNGLIADSRLEVLQGAGHVPTVTRPEAIAALISKCFVTE